MGEVAKLGKVLKFFLFLLGLGLLMIVMDKGVHNQNLSSTLGGTGEVLFFAGLFVLLLAKK
jgi:hypothetical protein